MIQLFGICIMALLLFQLELLLYRKFWSRSLHVDLQFGQESIFEGEEGALLEIVENRKRLPLSMLKVKFQASRNLVFASGKGSQFTDRYYRNDVFQIGGGERVTRTLSFTGGKRGFYRIDSCDLVASDLFLTAQLMRTLPVHAGIYVYPKPYDSREFRCSLRQLNGEVLVKRYFPEDPFEFRGIRDYQPYDDLRTINWKATARTGELKVNQKNHTSFRAVRIFLNLEDDGILKKENCIEASLRIAAGLCEFFLGQGMQVSCYGNSRDCVSGEPLALEARAGSGQMSAVYRSLARADTGDVLSFAELLGERLLDAEAGAFTCLVAPNSYRPFVELVERFQETGSEFVWFYPHEGMEPKPPESVARHIRLLDIRQ